MSRWKKVLALVLSLCMLGAVLAGCDSDSNTTASGGSDTPTKTDGDHSVSVDSLGQIHAAASYDEVKAQFQMLSQQQYYSDDMVEDTTSAAGEEVEGVIEGGSGTTADFSQTNVQVEGVDEADTVKTDGQYIYVLSDNAIRILKADGENTALVSTIQVEFAQTDSDSYSYLTDLLLSGDRLFAIGGYEQWGTDESGAWYNSSTTRVFAYDTADKTAPKLLGEVAQDGNYQDARLINDEIYLISNYSILYFDETMEDDDCIPHVYGGQEAALLPPEDIYVCPNSESSSYTVVSKLSTQDGAIADTCAFTDATMCVYMNRDALYLARSVNAEGESEPYKENQYTVVDYANQTQTEIKRIDLNADTLALKDSCTVPGYLLNQFSMDVYNGYLRVATTDYTYSYSAYTDETYGWTNTVMHDSGSKNCVTVLDENLRQVGSIDNLVDDEQIYSVRFMGDIGYVVTYQTIDPIFTIDLSDPANPAVKGELEVPGVSEYLHPYSDGLLLGFGEAVNADAVSDGLQLTMFDVSNPANVTVQAQQTLDASWSEAQYNHNAMLISAEKQIIAFPTDAYSYQVYTYESGKFVKKSEVGFEYISDGARGLYIGDCLYICGSDMVYAVDMASFAQVASVSFAVG